MSNINAAVGLAQLEDIARKLTAKKDSYEYIKSQFKDCSEVNFLDIPRNIEWNHWLFPLSLIVISLK